MAQLYWPLGLSLDISGNLFISDHYHNRVRVVTNIDGIVGVITTYIGTGTAGYIGDGGVATSAEIHYPIGITVDSSGNLYFGDDGNSVVRVVSALFPTGQPTRQPSTKRSSQPLQQPSGIPTTKPSSQPSRQPTSKPSQQTKKPTIAPSIAAGQPTPSPTVVRIAVVQATQVHHLSFYSVYKDTIYSSIVCNIFIIFPQLRLLTLLPYHIILIMFMYDIYYSVVFWSVSDDRYLSCFRYVHPNGCCDSLEPACNCCQHACDFIWKIITSSFAADWYSNSDIYSNCDKYPCCRY